MNILSSLVAAYLLGSIPFALMLAERAGIDVRQAGSGNVGAANVLRTTGPATAVGVLVLDALKGALAVWITARAGGSAAWVSAAAVAAVVGHVYPAWLGFRGGKGVATALGAFGAIAPSAAAACVTVFVATIWATRYVSLGSILSIALLGPAVYAGRAPAPVVLAAVATAAVVLHRHRANIGRLHAGTERRFGQRV